MKPRRILRMRNQIICYHSICSINTFRKTQIATSFTSQNQQISEKFLLQYSLGISSSCRLRKSDARSLAVRLIATTILNLVSIKTCTENPFYQASNLLLEFYQLKTLNKNASYFLFDDLTFRLLTQLNDISIIMLCRSRIKN